MNVQVEKHVHKTFVINPLFHICQKKIADMTYSRHEDIARLVMSAFRWL